VSWFGLLAPVGVPKDITARVRRDLARAMEVPEVRQRLTEGGFDVVASSPEEFLKFVQGESDKLGKLIRDNGIKVE
jgi:tripartite-type tricarboxylate transporter receptor subunit TctC